MHDVLAEKVKGIIAMQENPAGYTVVVSGGPNAVDPHEEAVTTGIALFELYMALQEFAKFRQLHQLEWVYRTSFKFIMEMIKSPRLNHSL